MASRRWAGWPQGVTAALATFLASAALGGANETSRRDPVPGSEQQEEAERTIKEIYAAEYAKKEPADQAALGGKLLQEARDTSDDSVGRFVLLRESADLAERGGDYRTALSAIDQLASAYVIDVTEMRLKVLRSAVRAARTEAEIEALFKSIMAVADAEAATDRFDESLEVLVVANTLARKLKGSSATKDLAERRRQVGARKELFDQASSAAETLAKSPNDSDANLAVGKYLCFAKGEWDEGLAKLALGSDSDLAALAKKDLAGPAGTEDRVALADGWSKAAQEHAGVLQRRILARAAFWYLKGAQDLSGLAKMRIQKRLTEIGDVSDFVVVERPKATGDTLVLDLGKGVAMTLRLIQPGSVAGIAIEKPYFIGTTEVTQAQWIAVMGDNPSKYRGDTNLPVDSVGREDIDHFLAALSKLPASKEYRFRLPTRDEWGYAGRAGSGGKYFFGEDTASLDQYAWYDSNSQGTTHATGKLKPNAWGLYDVYGNVYEWIADMGSSPGKGLAMGGSYAQKYPSSTIIINAIKHPWFGFRLVAEPLGSGKGP